MEKWQRDHIQQNISQLVDLTTCDLTFLLAFQSKGLLTQEDVSTINSIKNTYHKSAAFYELIQKRANSYDALKAILHETKQSGTLLILDQVNAKNVSTPFKNLGTISYDKTKLLGRGSYNTKVYQGRFDNRDVAVKLLSVGDIDGGEREIALKEIDILKDMDWHINVVRYFKAEMWDDFILIAIELCTNNLKEWIANPYIIQKAEVEILKQITQGLAHLHHNKLLHRDLKPENILIACQDEKNILAKISDFGLSRKLQHGNSKVTLDTAAVGTEGWMAPEVIRQLHSKYSTCGKFKTGLHADIFSLGCIFYYVLSGGGHPFGNSLRRHTNIFDGKSEITIQFIKAVKPFQAESFIWLINQMIKQNVNERPKADVILVHPAFWKARRILNFFEDIYPYIDSYYDILENPAGLTIRAEGWNWMDSLNHPILNYLKASGGVSGRKCSHLLKIIVEMYKAYLKLPEQVQQLLGNSTDKYFIYWGDRFPFLLPLLWTIFQYSKNSVSILKTYYAEEQDDFKFAFVEPQPTGFTGHVLNKSLKKDVKPLLNISENICCSSNANKYHEIQLPYQKYELPKTEDKHEMRSNHFKDQTHLFSAHLDMENDKSDEGFQEIVSENKATRDPGYAVASSYGYDYPTSINKLEKRKTSVRVRDGKDVPLYTKRIVKGLHGSLTEEMFFKEIFSPQAMYKPLIISGQTGMGKTTFLFKIKEKFLRTFQGRRLFYFKMKDVVYATKVLNGAGRLWTESVWKVLRRLSGESELGMVNPNWKSVNYTLATTELVFDGFDEVQSKDRNLAYDILKLIYQDAMCVTLSHMSIRMWISTLPEDLHKINWLPQSNVLFYHMQSLDEIGQAELIASYWEKHTSEDKAKIVELADKCVRLLNSSRKFELGNALQCLLVGAACIVGDSIDFNNSPEFTSTNILDLNKSRGNWLLDAARNSSFRTLELILNLKKFHIDCMNSRGDTPLFLSVVENYNVDCLLKMKLLIAKGANLNHVSVDNYNLLQVAAQAGSLQCLEYILSLNTFDIDYADDCGDTPLFLSVFQNGNVDCIPKLKLLIDHDSNINHLNKDAFNLLLYAARYASVESLAYILSLNKFAVDCVDKWGYTPLFYTTVYEDNVDCLLKLKLLIGKNANMNHVKSNNTNLLLFAAQFASAKVFEYIVSLDKYDINNEDSEGNTPLLLSIFHYEGIDCLTKLKLLLARGANLDHLNNNKSNLLHYAAHFASNEVLKYVINLGRFDINSVDKFGQTALHYARTTDKTYGVKSKSVDAKLKVKLLKGNGCSS